MGIASISNKPGAIIACTLWLAAGALAAQGAWLVALEQPRPAPPPLSSSRGAPVAAQTPYTVLLQESTRNADGDVSPQGTLTVALRADGAYVERYQYLGGQLAVILRTIDLPTGETVIVDDVRERRTTTLRRVGTALPARLDSSQQCTRNSAGETIMPAELRDADALVGGYRAVHLMTGSSSLWLARNLGCAKLRSLTQLPGGVLNEKVAVSVAAGEPDGSLFSVPERYEEVPYSVFYEIEPGSPEAMRLDRIYFSRRPRQ